MTEPEFGCLLCDAPGLHVHEWPARPARGEGMTTTNYRLVDDRDGTLVLETASRRLFREALLARVDHEAGGFSFPDHYTITVTETASGDDVGPLAWSIVR